MGVGVGVGVGVAVGVAVGLEGRVGVGVGVGVGVEGGVGLRVGVGVSVGVGKNVGVEAGVAAGVALVQPTPTIAARRSKVEIIIRITGLTPQFQKPIHIGAAINTGDRRHCQMDERFRTIGWSVVPHQRY